MCRKIPWELSTLLPIVLYCSRVRDTRTRARSGLYHCQVPDNATAPTYQSRQRAARSHPVQVRSLRTSATRAPLLHSPTARFSKALLPAQLVWTQDLRQELTVTVAAQLATEAMREAAANGR